MLPITENAILNIMLKLHPNVNSFLRYTKKINSISLNSGFE